jgi:hypothetical protein
VGNHNLLEEGILEHPGFRKKMSQLGIGEIWITPELNQVSYSVTDRKLVVKGTDNFIVYNIQGMKVADVRNNSLNTKIEFKSGIYLVRTSNEAFKVLIK